jgi:caffeoyl-CoA O-methyltransferase
MDAVREGIPPISIGFAQATLMQVFLRLMRAKDVVEVGTLAGYSAIAMAMALPKEGRVRTIELSNVHADFAEAQVKKSQVAGRVQVLRGTGAEHLAQMPAESADAIFLDADKGGYTHYLEEGMRILRPGGLIMVDNAFAFGELFAEQPRDRETAAVRAFNEVMAKRTGLTRVLVPVGDGLWVAIKNG